ncbi:uncharacterized protein LOC120260722 [Dioscorea cayenensis subsp. rotundata]|uniref:Uncharacterized protein LOC120260722 n=1 Tax=Dioscorea cayennensis subsp. rotundata TaxID=55577 RepID=A0AB40BAA0_DIOCR|nr:uncharacterized protein LOC120260722 [Dioscorea cayenensis subsp. rotundata]
MANTSKKQDLKDLESLMREIDEKHSKSIQEVREQNLKSMEEVKQEVREQTLKSMEEIKLLISGIALQNTEVQSHTQSPVMANSSGILGAGWNSSVSSHYSKIEFPRFDGIGLVEWLFKVEQFFEIDHTLEPNKVKMVSIHLEGKALHWYKAFLNMKDRGKVYVWKEFVEALTHVLVSMLLMVL